MTCVWTHNTPAPMSAVISAHSPNPLEKWWGLAPSHLYGWFEEGMLPPSAPAPNISKVPKRLHSQQSHKLFIPYWRPCKHPLHVQKVSWYLSGIMIIQVLMVENNGGQKVCITAWQFSTFNLSRNRFPHSELSYSTSLHRLVPNLGKFFKKICCPILIIWVIFIIYLFVLLQNVSAVHWSIFTRPVKSLRLH
jgi:hypothetical protein